MNKPNQAVFLSYASQDAGAAQRICEALRGCGIEVWFDQSELRGGDAWDAKIKRQIRDCALFMPLISENTQARSEGYFRREWRMAVDRMRDLADDHPFLVPIVIDDISDSEARVPEQFLERQWIRLPGGASSPEFCGRVADLLERPARTSRPPGVRAERLVAERSADRDRGRSLGKWVGFAAFGGAAIAVAIWSPWRAPARTPNPQQDPAATAAAPGKTAVQSPAVATPPAAVVPEAPTPKTIEPAQQAAIVEQTNPPATEARPAIASVAPARGPSPGRGGITPQDQTLAALSRPPNSAAFEAYRNARDLRSTRGGMSPAGLQEQARLLQSAVQADGNYVAAHLQLATVLLDQYAVSESDPTKLENARLSIDAAAKLAPGSAEVRRVLGDYYFRGTRDYEMALLQFEDFARLRPNDPLYYNFTGAIHRFGGRWPESLANWKRAAELAPEDLPNLRNYATLLCAARRFDESIAAWRKVVERDPNNLDSGFSLAFVTFVGTGSTKEMDRFFASLTPEQATTPLASRLRVVWALRHGDLNEVVRLERQYAANGLELIDVATALRARGGIEAARLKLGTLPDQLRRQSQEQPRGWNTLARLGMAEALLGNKAAALSAARRALEIVPPTRDAVANAVCRSALAFVYTWTGDKDAAIAEYASLLKTPYASVATLVAGGSNPDQTVHSMKVDPRYAPLRDDPRFEALVRDPKNNESLF